MTELIYDIARGASYKFNSGFTGMQVRHAKRSTRKRSMKNDEWRPRYHGRALSTADTMVMGGAGHAAQERSHSFCYVF